MSDLLDWAEWKRKQASDAATVPKHSGPWYHGGCPGLLPGDSVSPPTVTGALTFAMINRELAEVEPAYTVPATCWRHCKPDRVYAGDRLTTATEYAQNYSSSPWLNGLGSIYRVTPMGRVIVDPDPSSSLAYAVECDYAIVESVIQTEVPKHAFNFDWLFQRTWQDYRRLVRA